MEVISNHLNIINKFFAERPQATLTVSQTDVGNYWLIADDDIELAAVIVVRYMIKNNYPFIGQLKKHSDGNNHTLFTKSF